MRIRGYIVEYDLRETAVILGISQTKLRKEVREGKLRYFYNNGNGYKFHDAKRGAICQRQKPSAPLDENRRRLEQG